MASAYVTLAIHWWTDVSLLFVPSPWALLAMLSGALFEGLRDWAVRLWRLAKIILRRYR